jgi:hypothetical protein
MKIKYIKAKRCYICGKLTDVSDGGWLIAKRYFVVLYGGINHKDVFICEKCSNHMMKYIESQKESEEEE